MDNISVNKSPTVTIFNKLRSSGVGIKNMLKIIAFKNYINKVIQ